MQELELENIWEYAPGNIRQFSNFWIHVRPFSFHPDLIVQLNRNEHFK